MFRITENVSLIFLIAFFVLKIIGDTSAAENKPGRFLSQPNPMKCARRPKQFTFKGHNYFFSGHLAHLKNTRYDWLDARNYCREYCMDSVSIETEEENNMIYKLIRDDRVPFIWTSGRLCDFKGCENRPDLEPKLINGWFWSGSNVKMDPTNRVPSGWSKNPWSRSGHKKQPQPDNAEEGINGTTEPCLAVLNNVYSDGIAWHDIACYHDKPFVCEDSEQLLKFVASSNPFLRL